MELTERIHKFIEENRLLQRISYNKMADAIGYSPNGVKKALSNATLSLDQLKYILIEFDLRTKFEREFDEIMLFDNEDASNTENRVREISASYGKIDISKATDEQLELELLKRWKTFRERPMIKTVLDSEREVAVSKRVMSIVKNKESLKEYLNS